MSLSPGIRKNRRHSSGLSSECSCSLGNLPKLKTYPDLLLCFLYQHKFSLTNLSSPVLAIFRKTNHYLKREEDVGASIEKVVLKE